MCSGFARAREAQAFEKTHGAAESDDLEAERFVRGGCFCLQLADELCAQTAAAIFGKQCQFDAADLVFAAFDDQPADWLSIRQNYFVRGISVIASEKLSLRLVLHPEKLADSIFIPTKPAQIVATAALIEIAEERIVPENGRATVNRIMRGFHMRDSSRTSSEFKPQLASVRTASGSDRIQRATQPQTLFFVGYCLIRSLPLAVLTLKVR